MRGIPPGGRLVVHLQDSILFLGFHFEQQPTDWGRKRGHSGEWRSLIVLRTGFFVTAVLRPPFRLRNRPTTNCVFPLDTPRALPQNPLNFSQGDVRKGSGGIVQYLPGWTVQCINPECAARGQWLRADQVHSELCSNCAAPLHRVPPPLGPRMRMRPRTLGTYRPLRPRR